MGVIKGKGGGFKSWFQAEAYLITLQLEMAPLLHIWAFEAANTGALQSHISSQLPITAGWTAAFVNDWLFWGLPKPNEIFDVGTMPGFEHMIFWPQELRLS